MRNSERGSAPSSSCFTTVSSCVDHWRCVGRMTNKVRKLIQVGGGVVVMRFHLTSNPETVRGLMSTAGDPSGGDLLRSLSWILLTKHKRRCPHGKQSLQDLFSGFCLFQDKQIISKKWSQTSLQEKCFHIHHLWLYNIYSKYKIILNHPS